MKLKIKLLREDAFIPTRGSEKASGLDLYAVEDITILQGETKLIKTGVVFGIPEGFEVQIRPRSGLSLKTGLIVKNSPGTVDQDYTGECAVIMHFLVCGVGSYDIKRGDRIAQAVLCPVIIPEVEVVTELEETERGSGGFGHTGK
jgi:dUTP pyrophosphatase